MKISAIRNARLPSFEWRTRMAGANEQQSDEGGRLVALQKHALRSDIHNQELSTRGQRGRRHQSVFPKCQARVCLPSRPHGQHPFSIARSLRDR